MRSIISRKIITSRPTKLPPEPTHPWGTISIFDQAQDFLKRLRDNKVCKEYYYYLLQNFISYKEPWDSNYVGNLIFIPKQRCDPFKRDLKKGEYWLSYLPGVYQRAMQEWVKNIFEKSRSSILVLLALNTCQEFAKWIENDLSKSKVSALMDREDYPHNIFSMNKEFKKDITGMVSGAKITFNVCEVSQIAHYSNCINPFFPLNYKGVAEIIRCPHSENFMVHEANLEPMNHYAYEKKLREIHNLYVRDDEKVVPCIIFAFLTKKEIRESQTGFRPISNEPLGETTLSDLYNIKVKLPIEWVTGEFENEQNSFKYFSLRRVIEERLLDNGGEFFKPLELPEVPLVLKLKEHCFDPISISEFEIKQQIKINTLPDHYKSQDENPNHIWPYEEKLVRPPISVEDAV
jgi:hypothetical protein